MVRSIVRTLAVLLLVSGCSRSTSPPVADNSTSSGFRAAAAQPDRDPGSFYPLVSGNRWSYDREYFTALRPLGDTVTFRGTARVRLVRTIDCPSTFDGSVWWVETTLTTTENSVGREWLRMRQDRSGLYELETVPTPEYPCGPSGPATASIPEALARSLRSSGTGASGNASLASRPEAGALLEAFQEAIETRMRAIPGAGWGRLDSRPSAEWNTVLTRLSYPLHVGANWAIRPEVDVNHVPVFSADVEAHESIDLPAGRFPAYRIRIHSPFFRPGDLVRVWYGRAGFLALHVDVTFPILGEEGQLLGEGRLIDETKLTSIGP